MANNAPIALPEVHMKNITLTIEYKPLTVKFDGQEIEVQELSVRLPFGRKPSDITDIAGCGDSIVYVTETREMEPEEFDGFAMNLYKSRDWLKGKGGYLGQGRLCIQVHAPGRPYLFIDPSGGDYPRYVARLG
jgi:hypothetical protein